VDSTAVLVPVLDRPHRVAPTLAAFAAHTTEPYRLLFIVGEDDRAELAALERAGAEYLVVDPVRSSYACKINDGYHDTTEPWVFTAADDVLPHDGWLTRAIDRAASRPGIGVVGTADGGLNPRVAKGQHSVHTLIRRSYVARHSLVFDQADTILHEGYLHAFCDDEMILRARMLRAYVHAPDAVVEHLHPHVGLAPWDATYERGRLAHEHDRTLLRERRRMMRRPRVRR
jgi:hypothetical protein